MVAMHRIIYISVSFPERYLSEVSYHLATFLMVIFTLSAHLFCNECRITMASHHHGIVVVCATMNISFIKYAYMTYYLLGHQENVGVGDIHLERFPIRHDLMILTL